MKKFIAITALVLTLCGTTRAQSTEPMLNPEEFIYKDLFFGGWEMAFPVNSDFLTKASFAGASASYRRMITPHWSAGIAGSWNSFEQYTKRQTYQRPDGSGAITTDLIKYIYTMPITVTGHYYFNGSKMFKPYVGLGLGAQYSEQSLYFNIYSYTEENWGFVARPEIGMIVPFNEMVGVYASGAFNFATNKSESFDIDNLRHFAVQIGVSISLH